MILFKNIMIKHPRLSGLLFLIIVVSCACEKEATNTFSLEFRLIDESGTQKSIYSESDSLIFEFYLTNHSGEDATYLRPCSEFAGYLNIYQASSNDNYSYYGRPEYNCADIAIYDTILNWETVKIGSIPWSVEHGWPDKELAKYYVGDTLSLSIEGGPYKFVKKIYFKIE
jgi:hypothetical protein